jgi:hypothetical protein
MNYVIYTWDHAHVHSGSFTCTQDELPTELARKAGIPREKLIRFDVVPSREAAVAHAKDWNRSVLISNLPTTLNMERMMGRE